MLEKVQKRITRHARIRAKISGTATRPRLAIFRSNAGFHAQLIDDDAGKTLCAVSDLKLKKGTKTEKATQIGEEIAKKAIALGLSSCVFDRGGFTYHGRVKAFAEAARTGGLVF
jgi:large subunit ribosomal protein L18